jgi:cytosine/adenosine deaminase-related metal-dependent hydrolase
MESMLIAKNKCFAALNPSSNLNNAVGIADWTTLSALKSSCVLGNDGLGFNIAKEYQNFLFLMKYQTGSPVGFGNDELKKMIENSYTLASKLLGIKLGKISCGYEADMLVLPYFPFTPINHGNIFSHVSNGIFDSFHPTDVIAAGEFLMKNSRLKADEAQINNNSVSIAQKVWDSL